MEKNNSRKFYFDPPHALDFKMKVHSGKKLRYFYPPPHVYDKMADALPLYESKKVNRA